MVAFAVLFSAVAVLTASGLASPLTFYKNGEQMGNAVCPDGSMQCPDGNTCCITDEGRYVFGLCCPHVNAVCCSDGIHCCPQGYTCDLTNGKCLKAADTHPLMALVTLSKQKVKIVVYPDNKEECKDGQTYCATGSGFYCCPEANAVCCSDQKHCCPQGYDCAGERCLGSESQRHPLLALLSHPEKQAVSDDPNPVICGNGVDTCPTDNTCCYNKSQNKYGCCPSYNAVCCDDGQECCPSGYLCDAKEKTCKRAGLQQLPFMKIQ